MLKKTLLAISLFSGFSILSAQTKTTPIELTNFISNVPIYQEASLGSPVIYAINASNTKMQYLDFKINESNQKVTNKESILSDNLFFKVQVFSNNKAKDSIHGMEEVKGYVPAYYVLKDNNFQTVMKMIYPEKTQEPNSLPKKEEKNNKKKK